MAKMNPLMLAPPLIFAGLAMILWIGMMRKDPDQLPSALIGKQAPAVDVVPLGDKPVLTDADLRAGQITMVNFWASWCAPCRVEHPNLTDLAARGFQIYGVNYKDTDAKALKFMGELGDPYTAIGADPQGKMALNWGAYGVPETFVIDGTGKIILRHAGPITQRVIEQTILPAIEEATGG